MLATVPRREFLVGPDHLREDGLQARVEFVDDDRNYFGMIYGVSSPDHPETYLSGWISDYPGAANFIRTQFACGAFNNSSGLCDEDLDAAINEALTLNATDPGAANRARIDIEHGLVEDAAQAPLVNFVATHALSDRRRASRSIRSGGSCSAASECADGWSGPIPSIPARRTSGHEPARRARPRDGALGILRLRRRTGVAALTDCERDR